MQLKISIFAAQIPISCTCDYTVLILEPYRENCHHHWIMRPLSWDNAADGTWWGWVHGSILSGQCSYCCAELCSWVVRAVLMQTIE